MRVVAKIGVLVMGRTFVWKGSSAAQEEKPLQEPFQTETAYPQERTEMQITFASVLHWTGAQHGFEFPLRSGCGITDSLQMDFGWRPPQVTNSMVNSADNAADVEFGAKDSFTNTAQSSSHPAIGLDLTVPTRHAGGESTSYEPFVVVAHDFRRLDNAQEWALPLPFTHEFHFQSDTVTHITAHGPQRVISSEKDTYPHE